LLLLLTTVLVLGATPALADHGEGLGVTDINCNRVIFTYSGFANAENNTVEQFIKVNGVIVSVTNFSFNGPTGTDTVPIKSPTGEFIIDAHATWNTNGVRGNFDHHIKAKCKPAYTIQKLQEIKGSEAGFTTAPLTAKSGQTVSYEIVVTNTGNMPVTFGPLNDPKCDEGTIAGGPEGGVLQPETSATFTCEHLLTEGGPYTNTATITGTPESGEPITETSNTVVVNVTPEPSFTIEKLQKIDGSAASFTTAGLIANVGQTMDYLIVVTNTGNVPLTMTLVDAKCEGIEGGPGLKSLAPGETTQYTCHHLLNEKDRKASTYINNAKATGAPPKGLGPSVTHLSNTVFVNFPGHGEGEGITEIACNHVTFTYSGFPNLPENTVEQFIKVNGVLISETVFVFDGPTGSDTVTFPVTEGTYIIDAHATWKTNGISGNFDHHLKITCSTH
jgi:hypothetical protein